MRPYLQTAGRSERLQFFAGLPPNERNEQAPRMAVHLHAIVPRTPGDRHHFRAKSEHHSS